MIPALVLAAGRSTRMGRLKATLPLDDRDVFITRIIRTFDEAAVSEITVVVGYEASRISQAIERSRLSPRIVLNPGFDEGQFSSLLTGLHAIDRPEAEAMLLTLVDAPLFSADTVRAVIERYLATRLPIVRPVRGNDHGHPVLIDRTLFPALWRADPAQGAKPIVRGHACAAGDVEVADEGAFMDIDTPEDYERAIGWLQGQPGVRRLASVKGQLR